MSKRTSDEALKHMRTFYKDNPFLGLLKIRIAEVSYGRVRLDVDIAHELTNVYHVAHGGVAMTLADTAAGAACLTCNRRVVTLDCTLNYIKPIPENSRIYAVGTVVHEGKHTMVCSAEVFNEYDQLCVRMQGTFFVLKEYTDTGDVEI